MLANDADNVYSGIIGEDIEIEANALYLLGGWIRSPEGNAVLGYNWSGDIPAEDLDYTNVADRVSGDGWRHYGVSYDGRATEGQGREAGRGALALCAGCDGHGICRRMIRHPWPGGAAPGPCGASPVSISGRMMDTSRRITLP